MQPQETYQSIARTEEIGKQWKVSLKRVLFVVILSSILLFY